MEAVTTQGRQEIKRLNKEKQELQRELKNLRAELRSMAEPSADEADLDAYEREKTWAIVRRIETKIDSIDRAIELAKQGKYGICESCGERIDPARLEILPEVTLCLNCQRELERTRRRG